MKGKSSLLVSTTGNNQGGPLNQQYTNNTPQSNIATPITNQSEKVLMEINKMAHRQTRQRQLTQQENQLQKSFERMGNYNQVKNSSTLSENIDDDEEVENLNEPNKPTNQFNTSSINTIGIANIQIASNLNLSPDSKGQQLQSRGQTQRFPQVNDLLLQKNEQTQQMESATLNQRLTGVGRQYVFESQPISKLKRVRSQTAAQEKFMIDENAYLTIDSNQVSNSLVGTMNKLNTAEMTMPFDKRFTHHKLSIGFNHHSPNYQNHQTLSLLQESLANGLQTVKHHTNSISNQLKLNGQQFGSTAQNQSSMHNLSLNQVTMASQQQANQQNHHESIENLYTLKKVQSKVRDKIVPWIDFSSTSATFNHKHTEEATAVNSQSHQETSVAANPQRQIHQSQSLFSSGGGLLMKLSQINIRKKQYGSPNDKMQTYNFFQFNTQSSMPKIPDKSFDRKSNNQSMINEQREKFHEDSLCITEENRFQNEINPIKIADLGWGDEYKLTKLIRQQKQSVEEGKFDPESYFGGIHLDEIDQAFSWFDIAKTNFEEQMIKRKSSAGIVNNNTFHNQSMLDLGAKFQFQTIIGENNILNHGASIIGFGEMGDFLVHSSSSDDEGEDEAEKFKNTFLKNNGSNFYLFSKQQENNLLIKAEQFEEEDFNKRTPKVLSDNGSDNEEEKENRPLIKQQALNFEVLEELIEESREESMRAESNTHFYIPLNIQQDELMQQNNEKTYSKNVQQNHFAQNDDEELEEDRQNRQINNRLYDSDIFVMSDNTFDEDLASKSSRRVSAGRQSYKNDFLSFVDNSQDLKNLNGTSVTDSQQLNGITSKLFFHQQNQQLIQRRQFKYNQNQHQKSNGHLLNSEQDNRAQSNSKVNKSTMKPLTSSLQAILSSGPNVSNSQQNIQLQISTNHAKQGSLTKFSNYVSSSSNLTPTPNAYAKAYQKYKEVKNTNKSVNQGTGKSHQSNQNSMGSFNIGSQNAINQNNNQPSLMNRQIFQIGSGHQSIISSSSAMNSNTGAHNHTSTGHGRNGNLTSNNLNLVSKSHSNENFSKQAIAISTQLIPQVSTIQKATHHSPQCSIMMRPNLSPGPGYKMRERNSMLYENTRNNMYQHLSESDMYSNSSKFVIIQSQQQQNQKRYQPVQQSTETINLQSKRTTTTTVKTSANLSKLKNSHCMMKQSQTRNELSDSKKQNLNGTTQDSKRTKQTKTMNHNELKQQLNAAKLRKQRSDTKINTSTNGSLITDFQIDGQNNMVTYKLLATIKQNMIHKLQQEKQSQSIIENDSNQQQPKKQLNRQRSKSEIETIHEISSKQKTLEVQKGKLQPLSPSRSLKTIYQNGKTMSDINKFFEERSSDQGSGNGSRSVIGKHNKSSHFHDQHILSKLSTEVNNQSIDPSSAKAFDLENITQSSISQLGLYKLSISGTGILKEPSSGAQINIISDNTSNSTQNSTMPWEMRKSPQHLNQNMKLNFGIQPHHQFLQELQQIQSPNAQLSQSYQLSTINMLPGMRLTKDISEKHHSSNHNSLANNIAKEVKTADYASNQGAKQANQASQLTQFSVMKQRIQKSPNKKSMMILNSSIGSNSNNISLIMSTKNANSETIQKLKHIDQPIANYSDQKPSK